MKLTTDFIRAAVEGETADGRGITAQQIDDMATSYRQDTYNARIWPEHIRGIMPDGLFKALGDVVEVKADTIREGALAGKRALFVKLEPHPDLITMVRSGQKVHLSIEMHPKFPHTGGAYLMGLGVTDSPASLGTGIMKFSTSSREESVFTEPQEITTTAEPFDTAGQLEHFNKMLEHFTIELGNTRAARDALRAEVGRLKADFTAQLAAKDAEILDLKGRIPASGYTFRPLMTGAELDGWNPSKAWR